MDVYHVARCWVFAAAGRGWPRHTFSGEGEYHPSPVVERGREKEKQGEREEGLGARVALKPTNSSSLLRSKVFSRLEWKKGKKTPKGRAEEQCLVLLSSQLSL